MFSSAHRSPASAKYSLGPLTTDLVRLENHGSSRCDLTGGFQRGQQ